MGVKDWVLAHKGETAGVAGAGVVAIYLLKSGKLSALTGGGSATVAAPTINPGGVMELAPPSGTSAPTSTSWTAPKGIIQKGSGFMVPGQAGLAESSFEGTEYERVTSKAELSSLQTANVSLFYQPAPGLFEKVTSKLKLGKGTPLFVKA